MKQALESMKSIENKTTSLLSTVAAVVAIETFGFAFLFGKEYLQLRETYWFLALFGLFVLSILSLIAGGCFSIVALRAVELEDVASGIDVLDRYVEDYRGMAVARVKEILSYSYAQASEEYKTKSLKKWRCLISAQSYLFVGLVSFAGFVLVLLGVLAS